jgi:RNA polymerase sigma-70 factor (ECF subfamily)
LHQTKEDIDQEALYIERARKDPERFAPLYDKYYKVIFLFIYRRTDEEELTADLTSQVFLKAIVNLPRYEFKGLPFSAWLYRIAINEVNQFFRNKKNARAISIEDAGIERLCEELDENNQHNQEQERLLTLSFNFLEQEELQLLELRFFEDRAFKEVAYLMGITENNAKVKTYRVLDKLKRIIKEQRMKQK